MTVEVDTNIDLHELGFAGVFSKPVDIPEMVKALRQRLQVA